MIGRLNTMSILEGWRDCIDCVRDVRWILREDSLIINRDTNILRRFVHLMRYKWQDDVYFSWNGNYWMGRRDRLSLDWHQYREWLHEWIDWRWKGIIMVLFSQLVHLLVVVSSLVVHSLLNYIWSEWLFRDYSWWHSLVRSLGLPLYEIIVDTLLSDCGMDPLPLPNQLRWFLSIILPHSFTLSIVIAASHALSFATNKNRVSPFR